MIGAEERADDHYIQGSRWWAPIIQGSCTYLGHIDWVNMQAQRKIYGLIYGPIRVYGLIAFVSPSRQGL